MIHAGLFEGFGGFSLAAHIVGWETAMWCEKDKFCQRILKYYFPKAKGHGDIRETDFTQYRDTIDVLSGGFPCQPYSNAGKRKGKDDDRHLWPEMLRAIREIHPRWVVGENVSGFVNWRKGMVLDEVQSNMEAEGYKVLPFVLPACAVNAPHRRDRVWIVAYSDSCTKRASGDRSSDEGSGSSIIHPQGQGRNGKALLHTGLRDIQRAAANTGESELQGRSLDRSIKEVGEIWKEYDTTGSLRTTWQEFPVEHPLCRGNDGLSKKLDRITFSSWRTKSLQGYGNAIVPQVAVEIFKTIEAMEQLMKLRLTA